MTNDNALSPRRKGPVGPRSGKPPAGYGELLDDLKARIRAAQVKAALSVNRELIALYWHIGESIVERQRAEGWGKAIVERLSADLQREFPGVGGFSAGNIWRMRAFFTAWTDEVLAQSARQSGTAELAQAAPEFRKAKLARPVLELGKPKLARPVLELGKTKLAQAARETDDKNLQQAVGELDGGVLQRVVAELDGRNLPQAVAEIPWGHNVDLVTKLKSPAERLWYAQQTVANGWSRSMLLHWIESRLHARHGKAVTNFSAALPSPQSDLAAEIVRDPYSFDFLTLRADAAERELERGLLDHIRKFLLELGAGFAFVGQQVHLEVDGEDYYLDLLFYHLRLRCYVVIDLKARPFKPEYAGKMNFYLSAVDDLLRHTDDKPSIGIILCKTRSRVIAEYALRNLAKPVGVARYVTRLVEALPDDLKGNLPTVEQIVDELARLPEPKGAKRKGAEESPSKRRR